METLKVKRLHPDAKLPTRGTRDSAGYDLCARLDAAVVLLPGERALIPTGIAVEIPRGAAGFVFGRSGLGVKHGISPSNAVGVIDSDYRGELLVGLTNHSRQAYTIEAGERIAQLVLMPVFAPEIEECDALSDTVRGEGGFGSTGR